MEPVHEFYFDCAASAPILPCAMEAIIQATGTAVSPSVRAISYANPNSVHSRGRDARADLEIARTKIAECIGAEPNEIYFAPSATAACRCAVGLLDIWWRSNHDHQAVKKSCVYLALSADGRDDDACAHILASNETGEIFIDEVKELVASGKTVFTDATAAMGHIPINVKDLGVAALAAGGHKFGAPPGIGFLYVRDGVAEYPISERDFTFPGTPPVALACAMADALKYRTLRMELANRYLYGQRKQLIDSLLEIPGAHINCADKPCLPNILSVRFDGINARELLTLLDVNGLCASAGSACHAEDDRPSSALLAAGLSEAEARSTIRLSWCEETRETDFVSCWLIIRDCVERLRTLGGMPV